MTAQLVHRERASGHADRANSERSPTLDVGRRITDHDDVRSRQLDSQRLSGTALRNRRELRPILMVAAERTNPESLGIDTRCTQLRVGAFTEISCQQSEDHVFACLERIEELRNSRVYLYAPALQLPVEQ